MIRSGDEPGLPENYQDMLTGSEPELSGSRRKAYQSLPINKLIEKMSDNQACRFACDCVERAMQGTAYVYYSDGKWLISYTRAYLNERFGERAYLDKTHILYEKFRSESLISDHIAEQHPRFMCERYLAGALVRVSWIPQRPYYSPLLRHMLSKSFMFNASNLCLAAISVWDRKGSVEEHDWQQQHAIEYLLGEHHMTDTNQWRSLIRVVGFNKKFAYIVIPSWDSTQVIPIKLDQLPIEIQYRITQKQKHFHAKVNIDATTVEALTFSNWEPE